MSCALGKEKNGEMNTPKKKRGGRCESDQRDKRNDFPASFATQRLAKTTPKPKAGQDRQHFGARKETRALSQEERGRGGKIERQ